MGSHGCLINSMPHSLAPIQSVRAGLGGLNNTRRLRRASAPPSRPARLRGHPGQGPRKSNDPIRAWDLVEHSLLLRTGCCYHDAHLWKDGDINTGRHERVLAEFQGDFESITEVQCLIEDKANELASFVRGPKFWTPPGATWRA